MNSNDIAELTRFVIGSGSLIGNGPATSYRIPPPPDDLQIANPRRTRPRYEVSANSAVKDGSDA